MTDTPSKKDYRDTVFLPKTDFPMKAGLPQKEPAILARWQAADQYAQLREARAGREKFILHDGPPYANGDMHIGHALNHVLKDTVVRTQTLLGKDAPYVPGWDCHGLPIEWKVEELYRKKKLDKKEVPAKEFRAECRAYAQGWVDVQREQLKRLGIGGRWDKPYLTMRPEAEGAIVAELMKFAESGQLYRGSKPVMWSPVEETALAEAEVEYEDLTDSPQIDVAFEIVESPIAELVGAYAVIWTTTPWTIPVNQALAYGPDVEYRLIELWASSDSNKPMEYVEDSALEFLGNRPGTALKFLVADGLHNDFAQRVNNCVLKRYPDIGLRISSTFPLDDRTFKGSDLAGTLVRHPMHRLGGFYAKPRPMLAGDFVTTESGTGIVHMSPDHGEDDFELCKANGIEPVFAVERDGRYRDDWLWLGGADERRRSVINKPFNAPDGPICSDLREVGALLSATADYRHSYPHSWRSKAKLIYRCTPQWFIGMDQDLVQFSPKTPAEKSWEGEGGAIDPADEKPCAARSLRQIAMSEIEATRFVPEKGRNRLRSMVEGRPDWLISRQRAWGVPIALFVHRTSGQLLVDSEVNARIIAAITADGVDAWEDARAAEFLGQDRNPDDYEMIGDILDVWFDSGCTHAFVLESDEWPELQSPADLYLEGSDQHRGWFQSSLLESCGTRGRAPYKAVLTHGFTMDPKGMKMSKSLGNTVDPLKVMEQYGADIIRLWALSVDYTEDHRIGDEILKGVGDTYRKLRNTFRYLLGALEGYSDTEALPVEEMPELERYVLALLGEVDGTLRKAVHDFDFNLYVRTLTDFCNEDLSAFYFDIRKDSLYCDPADGVKRRANRTVMDILFHALVRYAAPVLVFTSEEVWGTRFPDDRSVHLLEWPEIPATSADDTRWDALRDLRETAMEAIEPLRREKIIRSGLEAAVTVPDDKVPQGFSDADLAELFITASVTRRQGTDVTVTRTDNHKCGRCWRLLPEVTEDGDLCARCDDAVSQMDTAA
ncbi:isoleucine--tRNA ligase [Allopontixanthobacter sediminis]|uniref:Isoleucine--tRNA ligase n=1 Tax=Allopontixanthobacter sediminis TaxID=1689985 RepID=A0A845B1C5_9SPHN|nr:isoleucine--tRNA ligase [Allopontixanthobacter sediminis]MXP44365.1 isoleucine--tRNA ligase [Allopontixanthobacter sediminis]